MVAFEHHRGREETCGARMENVLSIVAPNPRYSPKTPSFRYIRNNMDIMERLFLPFPSLGNACIRVLALKDIISCSLENTREHLHI